MPKSYTTEWVDSLPPAATDLRFAFWGLWCFSEARLRFYPHALPHPILVVTEVHDNPGASITNACERVQAKAWRLVGRPWYCTFVEHYPGQSRIVRGRHGGIRLTPLSPLEREHADLVTVIGTSGDGPAEFVSPVIRARAEDIQRQCRIPLAGEEELEFGHPKWHRIPMEILIARLSGETTPEVLPDARP